HDNIKDNDPPAKDTNLHDTSSNSENVPRFDGAEGGAAPQKSTSHTVVPVIQFGSLSMDMLSASQTRHTWADIVEEDERRGWSEPPRMPLRSPVTCFVRGTETNRVYASTATQSRLAAHASPSQRVASSAGA